MLSRIEIGFLKGLRDAHGEKIKERIIGHLHIPVDSVRTYEIYTIDGDLDQEELVQAAGGPLFDLVVQNYAINRPLASGFDWPIEVGFRPRVTDNVGKTAGEAIAVLTSKKVRVYTSRQYAIGTGTLPLLARSDAERIASEPLANDLIQHYTIYPGTGWDAVAGLKPSIPKVTGNATIRTTHMVLCEI